jgi:hypothetical protein
MHIGRCRPLRRAAIGRVQTQPGKGQLRHVRLAKAHEPRPRRPRQHLGIGVRHPTLQQQGPGLRHRSGAVEQVLPTDRHTVQQAASHAVLRPLRRCLGLATRALGRQDGVNPIAVRMSTTGLEIRLGQLDRVDLPRAYAAPQVTGTLPQPIVHLAPALPRRHVVAVGR